MITAMTTNIYAKVKISTPQMWSTNTPSDICAMGLTLSHKTHALQFDVM